MLASMDACQHDALAELEDLRKLLAELSSRCATPPSDGQPGGDLLPFVKVGVDAIAERLDRLTESLHQRAADEARPEGAAELGQEPYRTLVVSNERLAAIKSDLHALIPGTGGLRRALDLVLDSVLQMEGVDSGCAYVVDSKSGGLAVVAPRGLSELFIQSVVSRSTEPNLGWPAGDVSADRIISYGRHDIDGWADHVSRDEGLRSLALVPIRHEGRPIATLLVGSHSVDEIPAATRAALEAVVFQVVGAVARITAEQARTDAVEILQEVISHAPLAIYVLDGEGRIVSWNESATRMFGWTEAEVLGERLPFIPGEKHGEYLEHRQRLLREGGLRGVELERVKKDGSPIHIRLSATVFRDDSGNLLWSTAMVEDITEKKQLEADQRRLSQLESLGVLAGGIAHDFNNLLMGIMGSLSLAKAEKDPSARDALLAVADGAADKASALAKQLLTFAKGGAPEKEIVSLGELLAEVAGFALTGSRVRLDLDVGADLWPAEVDPGQVSQVIQNLVINAAEAMPDGGTMTLRARNLSDEDGATFVQISITDTGAGIAPDIADRIFDPYFSTKQTGTGLGLTVAHSIVTRHGGRITATSHPGGGSTFSVLLPARPGAVFEPKADRLAPGGGGRAKILIVDDEEMVRKILLRMLDRLGHLATAVASGDEALAAYEDGLAERARFDLVITDLTMPGGLSGIELASELLKLDPDAKVIVSSGYSDASAVAEYQKYGFAAAVGKPYTLESLQEVLARFL